ncbi:unnamed protein product [Mortierella alpina]
MLFSKSLVSSALLVAALAVASVSAAKEASSSIGAKETVPAPPRFTQMLPPRLKSPTVPSAKKARASDLQNNRTIALVNANKFCMFLPPAPGLEIAPTEEEAIAFCKGRAFKGAKTLRQIPKGFIRSESTRYYEAPGKKFVQVTGLFNRELYDLSSTDGGGQYDYKNVRGSSCKGFPHYVSLVEPDVERFCIRCCQDKKDCNINKSHLGCAAVIPELP